MFDDGNQYLTVIKEKRGLRQYKELLMYFNDRRAKVCRRLSQGQGALYSQRKSP